MKENERTWTSGAALESRQLRLSASWKTEWHWVGLVTRRWASLTACAQRIAWQDGILRAGCEAISFQPSASVYQTSMAQLNRVAA